MVIPNKNDMYALLSSGRLGNTVPMWFSYADWKASPESKKYDWWGIRTLVPSGSCRLFCPSDEVEATVNDFAQPVNISVMVDAVCQVNLWADVLETDSGLRVEATEYPPKGANWRLDKPRLDKVYTGIAAHLLLRKHLNENSLEDLRILLDEYPRHVVELSNVSGCFGSREHRSAIVWECRLY